MTKEEAQKIIDDCRGWNTGQESLSLLWCGKRTSEDDLLDAKRKALKKAWEVIGEETRYP